MTLLEAIAAFEGFGRDPMNRPTRNNNPGNLAHGPHTQAHGGKLEEIPAGYVSQPRYARFETVEAGWQALHALLEGRYRGYTLEEMMYKYAPPSENDTAAYIQFICDRVGCKPETLVDELLATGR